MVAALVSSCCIHDPIQPPDSDPIQWSDSRVTLTSGSCSPLSSMSWRWRPLSPWDCSSAHSSSLRVTRRSPNLSSIRSHCRDFPEPGPPDETQGTDQSLPLTGRHGDGIQSEVTRRKIKRRQRRMAEEDNWEEMIRVCVCLIGLSHCLAMLVIALVWCSHWPNSTKAIKALKSKPNQHWSAVLQSLAAELLIILIIASSLTQNSIICQLFFFFALYKLTALQNYCLFIASRKKNRYKTLPRACHWIVYSRCIQALYVIIRQSWCRLSFF